MRHGAHDAAPRDQLGAEGTGEEALMAKGYKVCWWFPGNLRRNPCRTLSAKQHRSAREAAETVLMQNPGARVSVVSPRGGGRGVVYKLDRLHNEAVRVSGATRRR